MNYYTLGSLYRKTSVSQQSGGKEGLSSGCRQGWFLSITYRLPAAFGALTCFSTGYLGIESTITLSLKTELLEARMLEYQLCFPTDAFHVY